MAKEAPKPDPTASNEWQQLSETQKAYEKAKKERRRRGVSIAPSNTPGGEDEITIEPEDEGASPEAAAEYIAPDAPLDSPPESRNEKNKEGKGGTAKSTRPAPAQSEESNKVHGGAVKANRTKK